MKNKPDSKSEAELNKLGVFIDEAKKDVPRDDNYLAIYVEIGFPENTELDTPEFDVIIANPRGVKTRFSAFNVSTRGDQKIFSFVAYQNTPDNVPVHGNYEETYYTSYLDMCWKLGTNKIDDSVIPSVHTNPKEGAKHVDLGWVLPSRYVDSITNALGVLNNVILSGTMIDALIYGPYVSTKE